MKRAVFLDRDGVLNPMVERRSRWRAPLSLEAFQPFPWVADSVARLRAAGLLSLVVTNQPELSTGELSPAVLDAMHERLRREAGVDVAASFMVGDRYRDVDAGRAAGCVTILTLTRGEA
jgi:D-glycero-D-manno-heptose 1,7-bisphosphate phosphatase